MNELRNATPETLVLWNHLRNTFVITAVAPVYYQGALAGSEFLTYAANKLYFCLSISAHVTQSQDAAMGGYVKFYDQTNAFDFSIQNISAYWNSTSATLRGVQLDVEKRDFFFSRFTYLIYSEITFIGYRLTL